MRQRVRIKLRLNFFFSRRIFSIKYDRSIQLATLIEFSIFELLIFNNNSDFIFKQHCKFSSINALASVCRGGTLS